MNTLMQNKKGLVMGITNNSSIAWLIAKILSDNGAELAMTYPNDKIEKRLLALKDTINCSLLTECDVTKSNTIKDTLELVTSQLGKIDFLVHSIAFSDKNELKGRYLDTSLSNFLNTMHVSCYSFTEILQQAVTHMNPNASAISLTYYGANKVLPNYNVMGVAKAALEASIRYLAEDVGKLGIRINGISAGPIKTLAASGINDFNYILKWNAYNSPLRRNITREEVAKSALYLLSDLSSGVTGEIHYVDAGYNIVGMKAVDAPDLTKNHD